MSVLRVIKLGGSLLQEPRLPELARSWLAKERQADTIFVVGGGQWADAVREAYRRFDLSESFCHWLCVDLLDQTSSLAAELLQVPLQDDWSELGRGRMGTLSACVFPTSRFLRETEPTLPGQSLPHNWSVTSDSIAARIAKTLAADELVLWKSTSPPPGERDLGMWADVDYVDAFFPQAAVDLNVRGVDLTDG